VRKRLLTEKTPRMLCALGDLTSAPESTRHFTEAWELSGGRYSRAKRSIGREAFALANACQAKEARKSDAELLSSETRGHLETAEGALSAALSVHPSVTSDWFLLGTVRMRLEKWADSLAAFSTVVAHLHDSGDAWGNIGAIHLRLGRPDLALSAFNEGLKASRECNLPFIFNLISKCSCGSHLVYIL